MSDPDTEAEAIPPARQVRAWRRIAWPLRIGLYGIALLGLIGLIAWTQREDIARNLIGAELERQGVPATYDIESIGVGRQVVRNLVLGDPKRPDATIRRLTVDIGGGLFGLRVDSATVEGLRAFGRWQDGRVSFGSLDPLIYTGSTEPFSLPRLDLTLRDARVNIQSPYGAMGIKAEGSGNLRGGFKGTLAAIGDRLVYQGCTLTRPSLYGAISISRQRPQFAGPVRFDALACAVGGLSVGRSAIAVRAGANDQLDRVNGTLVPASGAIKATGFGASALAGNVAFAATRQQVDATLDLGLTDPAAYGYGFGALAAKGKAVLRMGGTSPGWSYEGTAEGRGLTIAPANLAGLDRAITTTASLPVGPLIARMVAAARRALPGSDLAMAVQARGAGETLAIDVPRLALTSARGERLVGGNSLSIRRSGQDLQLAGNIATGGAGLPQAQLRIVPRGQGAYALRLSMDDYAAAGASLALPELSATWSGQGALAFVGQARLSGPIPGGFVRGLMLPLQGRWSAAKGFALYDGCQTLRFDRLQLANLTADRQAITLCPQGREPMVRSGPRGLQLAARLDRATRFNARLGSAPIQLAVGSMQLDFPGTAQLGDVDLVIGDVSSGTHIKAGTFSVDLATTLGGRYADAEATIGVVPLLLTGGSGTWSYADSALEVAGDEWLLRDRQVPSRFQPLLSSDMRLRLADSRIAVTGTLDEPQTGVEVLRVAIAHDLQSVTGHADLFVDGIAFDDTLRPEMLSNLVLGVIANTRGSIAGTGRIDWTANGVVSSTGRFTTDSLNFAAAFGPVTGLSGDIVFTDLLNMATAPGQSVKVAEINTGVAAYDGLIRYRLLPGFQMVVEGGEWPFAGGRLLLEPGTINMVTDQPRALTFRLDSVDAAEFLRRFEFDNFNATGHFSGVLPIVFDQNGGHIRGGRLTVDEGGGTLAYVGELSYEDMGTMANFAFNALKSLRYTNLLIEMDGDLDGEVVTKVQFDGIQQGEGASRNFLTRQIEKLPLQFNVTISAPFLQLLSSARSLYDTNYITDPALFGLVPGGATPVLPATPAPSVTQPNIQPSESEPVR